MDVLGLKPAANVSEQSINAAFRRLALLVHPDKQPDTQPPSAAVLDLTPHADPATLPTFPELVAARERALREVRGRAGRCGEAGGGKDDDEADRLTAFAREWALYLANILSLAVEARTIHVDLSVSLADAYTGRMKQVDVPVRRRHGAQRERLYVPLIGDGSHAPLGRAHRFVGVGDDPPAVLYGGLAAHKRGDVVVHVSVASHDRFSPDTILNPRDLHIVLSISLVDHYCGATLQFEHLDGERLSVECLPASSSATDDMTGDIRCVQVLRDKGLPYKHDDATATTARGRLCVFMKLQLPRFDASELAHGTTVRNALDILVSCQNKPKN